MKHGFLNSPTDGHRVTGAGKTQNMPSMAYPNTAMPRPNVANIRPQMPAMPPAKGRCNCNGNQEVNIAKNNYPPPPNISLPIGQKPNMRQLPPPKPY